MDQGISTDTIKKKLKKERDLRRTALGGRRQRQSSLRMGLTDGMGGGATRCKTEEVLLLGVYGKKGSSHENIYTRICFVRKAGKADAVNAGLGGRQGWELRNSAKRGCECPVLSDHDGKKGGLGRIGKGIERE